ncbi:MAG TPA: alpha-2-macroglobulin family protein, partial [Chitinophagales bacterium]|nr:alpha-2-macroglobulin family protein [Chitinophagales bacterium]
LTRRGGRFIYDSQKQPQLMFTKKVSVGAAGAEVAFTPLTSGDYEVRVQRVGGTGYVSKEFHAYGHGDTDYSSFEVSNEGEVIIEADKEQYNAGDNANVVLKTPFDGKVLVTIERGDVLEHFYRETENRSVSFNVKLSEQHLPNVFITATAIRPMNVEANIPLTVARGFIPLIVEEPKYKLPVAIQSVESTHSRTKQTIKIKTVANAQVTIAAVDEGILQVRNFATPDPYGFFFAQKALEVTSYDLYPFLYPELASYRSSVGGDGYDMSKRVNPMSNKRVNLVAKWSGILNTNANGEATFTVDVPQFSGSLRVMAVAYKGKSFGSAEKQMRVADPVVISTALPRFITPGDTLSMPVMLSNTTTKPSDLSVTATATGPLKIIGTQQTTTSVGANTESQVVFRLAANPEPGESVVSINVSNGSSKYTDTTRITIRPAGGYYKVSNTATVKGGTNQTISLTADMIPNTMDAKLVVSRSPLTQFSSDLRYLLQYPYGCLEQSVSAAFPQLYYGDLVKSLRLDAKPQGYNPEYNVREAIRKVESMQLYNGAFSYWPGGTYDYPWVSIYATHFLLESKKAGFDVNQSVLDKALAYVQTTARKRETYDYRYWDASNIARQRKALNREVPYAAYVLALGGKYDMATLNFCKSNKQMLTQDAVYMVACAYALTGQLANYQSMLPDEFVDVYSSDELSGSFASPVRDVAVSLNCIMETNPDDIRVGPMAQKLSSMMKRAGWLNTQERSFALL